MSSGGCAQKRTEASSRLPPFFLPFFAQKENGFIRGVSLFALTIIQPYLKTLYCILILSSIISGILTLVLQNQIGAIWCWRKNILSFVLSIIGVFIFVVSRQPYSAIFVFMFLIIKASMLIKRK